ncbi:peptidoglycan editing factor PgeF [Brooklawnia cerclae]|uniref:Purine nucleoside phosphorylase n=1 Tax=Brooklawnia cerclae TaxID=349934 RepID=A0ABX0SHY9_9ACTN|nr:polyphenol oxidase family protein [Brooklawnia cerclae]NIH57509.1 hypothetical protein [Brooklawnia cerclae]
MFSTLIEPTGPRGVGVAFTDREGGVSSGALGSLNLGRSDLDDLDHLRVNMARVRETTGIGPVVSVDQVHGWAVHDADVDGRDWDGDAWIGSAAPGASHLPVADAVVTTTRGLALMIRVADCVPVVLADERAGVVGAAHAGRAGLLGGVLPAVVKAMGDHGARALQAWVGPHICGSCYEVPGTMADDAAALLPATRARTSWGTPSIDLGAGAQAQLERLGVVVHRVDPCTLTSETLYSHRGDGPGSGRQMGMVWLLP